MSFLQQVCDIYMKVCGPVNVTFFGLKQQQKKVCL